MVCRQSQSLQKKVLLLWNWKQGRAIGGALVENRQPSRFVTVHTKGLNLYLKKLKSIPPVNMVCVVVNIPKTEHFVTGITKSFKEYYLEQIEVGIRK
jgi:hypothetical protein